MTKNTQEQPSSFSELLLRALLKDKQCENECPPEGCCYPSPETSDDSRDEVFILDYDTRETVTCLLEVAKCEDEDLRSQALAAIENIIQPLLP